MQVGLVAWLFKAGAHPAIPRVGWSDRVPGTLPKSTLALLFQAHPLRVTPVRPMSMCRLNAHMFYLKPWTQNSFLACSFGRWHAQLRGCVGVVDRMTGQALALSLDPESATPS